MSQIVDVSANDWIRERAYKHVPSNVRTIRYNVFDGRPSVNFLGLRVDPQPIEGTVVESDDSFVMVKKAGSRNSFAVFPVDMIETVPPLKKRVRVSPYARKNFDGMRLDTPKREERGNGIVIQSLVIGGHVQLPIDRYQLKCEYLKDMITQLEALPDIYGRTIAQVMTDAGAPAVEYCDPEDEMLFETPPRLSFDVITARFTGRVSVIYDRGLDYYTLSFEPTNGEPHKIEEVDFLSLAEIIVDEIDDGLWQKAKVVYL